MLSAHTPTFCEDRDQPLMDVHHLQRRSLIISPHYFIHDTANTPHVHPEVIDTVCEQALRCSVPSRRYVLCEWVIGVDTLT